MLWKLKMWGGGDVKLFTAIATVIPFGLNINFLNIFPQLSVYPFAFSVVANSILVSFPFLLVFLIYLISKNETFKNHPTFLIILLNIENLKDLIHSTLNRTIPVKDLHEGNIVNNYYFNDEHIIELINEIDGNLEIYENREEDGFKYYFKSLSAGGITEKDTTLIKVMSAQGYIGDAISVKISYPFTPAIFLGLLIAVFYGDIMMLVTKNIVLVI
jgi:preflagellin peptidase FlaK